jgi:spermidine synthase
MRQIFLVAYFLLCVAYCLESSDIPESQTRIEPFHPPETNGFQEVLDFFLPHFERKNVIFSKESTFFYITVQDTERHFRKLVFLPDHGSQSKIDLEHPNDVILNFMRYSFIGPALLNKTPEKVLFIGLGAGTMPMFFRKLFPNSIIDIVEIDEGVLPVAEKYFGFKEDKKMKVINMDGRVFVNTNSNENYDLIFIDAYSAETIPFQVTTVEFFQNIKKNLKKEGIIIANIANFRNDEYTYSQFKTVNTVLPHLAIFVCPYQSNFVLFASQMNYFSPDTLKKKLKEFDDTFKCNFQLSSYYDSLMDSEKIKNAMAKLSVITDDLAPFGD